MEREAVFEVVRSLVVEEFGVDPATVTAQTTQSDLGIDSILMVNLMMDIEERLGLRLENIDLPRNPTMGDIVDLIESNNGDAA